MASNKRRAFDPGDVTGSVSANELAPVGSAVALVEWIDPGRPDGAERNLIPPVHVHWEDEETWYVLDGRLCVLLDDHVATSSPGGAATAVRGTRHTYWNPDPGPCRYLIETTPRLRKLIATLHDGSGKDSATVFREHASELFGWELPSPLRAATIE